MSARWRRAAAWLVVAGLCLWLSSAARAVTPDSPEVRAVLKKALRYLDTAQEGRLGGKCLIGLAYLKDGADDKHPKVVEAVQACQNATRAGAAEIRSDIYSTGIAIIFLCSLNPSKYQPEIVKLRDSLQLRQKSHGGWGYPDRQTGDTSMTQYGVLSYWEMNTAGIPIDINSTERVANWLLRTQGPEGNWGYQGVESTDGKPVKQDSARPGMTAAGLGCTFIAADILNLIDLQFEHDAELPPALRRVTQKQAALTNRVDLRQLRQAQTRGRDWLRANYKIDPPGFTHYYLYALERYQSFAEAAEGKVIKEPKWYNDGFGYLRKEQLPDGSWKGTNEGLDAVNAAFAVLFLLRSTKKAIEKSKSYGDGSLLAGRGLPADLAAVSTRGGQIVARQATATAKELIEILGRPTDAKFASVAADTAWIGERLAQAPDKDRAELISRLRTLAAIGVADARLAAVEVLGMARDLDSAPVLILALDDEDARVALAADESLKSIARQLSAPSLGEKPTGQARAAAVQRWKQWYLAIRPDAEFEN